MHSNRLPWITPHPMMDMLGLDRREDNDSRHKLSRLSVVSGDNATRDNPRKRAFNSRLAQIDGPGFVA
jgi:hypothetical protein